MRDQDGNAIGRIGRLLCRVCASLTGGIIHTIFDKSDQNILADSAHLVKVFKRHEANSVTY